MAKLPIKKMITEVLLILPLYLIWFFIWWRFRHLIKIMADAQNTLNNDNFSGDIVDTVDSLSNSNSQWEFEFVRIMESSD